MVEMTRRTQGVQQGARSVQVVEAVRAATVSELARVGYAALTIDGVAKAARVNRTTIYRRWPTRSALLHAVLEPLLTRYDTVPDAGSSWRDLSSLLRMVRDNVDLPEGRAFSEAARSTAVELQDLVASVLERALAPFHSVLARAVERGEIDPGQRDLIAQLAFFGVVMWDQTHTEPLSDGECDKMAQLLLPRSAAT
ncbi:TetR/AcrR family transcriptional regulator [Pseudarthrobacter sp. R1]|uniref:TetR/AcrR family transcriptional regulator n=1 Tax=Pseudarthrobacter sp. R1 TaxID=2944934 RepID=UPI00210D251D|nr:TetR/AcrR family transcriptional regulator [Pseudarthrobacter sp. R1]MCQ6271452.1 TetR/AcrR family transcriptional regulator [Pseudarthrobacter sp. R1]